MTFVLEEAEPEDGADIGCSMSPHTGRLFDRAGSVVVLVKW